MKNIVTIIISLSLFLFLIFVANSSEVKKQSSNSHNFDKSFKAKARALDGDSIMVGKKEVRLFGIDAPEYKQNCLDKNGKEYGCGKISFIYLKKLVNNKAVTCQYHKKDIYDRYLAKCFVGKISINDNLLENGMAVIYNYYKSSQDLKDLENKAKKNKLGIWQGGFELPRHYRKRNK